MAKLTGAVVNLVAKGEKKVRGQRNGVARNEKVKNKLDFPLFRGIQ